jgi:hypothetical protein
MVKTPTSKDGKQPKIDKLFKTPDVGAHKVPPPAHPPETSNKKDNAHPPPIDKQSKTPIDKQSKTVTTKPKSATSKNKANNSNDTSDVPKDTNQKTTPKTGHKTKSNNGKED